MGQGQIHGHSGVPRRHGNRGGRSAAKGLDLDFPRVESYRTILLVDTPQIPDPTAVHGIGNKKHVGACAAYEPRDRASLEVQARSLFAPQFLEDSLEIEKILGDIAPPRTAQCATQNDAERIDFGRGRRKQMTELEQPHSLCFAAQVK